MAIWQDLDWRWKELSNISPLPLRIPTIGKHLLLVLRCTGRGQEHPASAAGAA